MFEAVRDQLSEVIEIADKCPEKYQVKCFEILLDALVRGEAAVTGALAGAQVPVKPAPDFFSKYNISQDEWTRVFDFDGTLYEIIVANLKDKTKAGKQVKLGLLLGIKSLLETDTASIARDSVIDLCKHYAAYDATNFSKHMKTQKGLFIRKGDVWQLTAPGIQKAAEVIKELAQ